MGSEKQAFGTMQNRLPPSPPNSKWRSQLQLEFRVKSGRKTSVLFDSSVQPLRYSVNVLCHKKKKWSVSFP